MHLIYVDDSFEKPFQIYAAIAIPAASWRVCFGRIQEWRRELKRTDGILITKEFHATEFVSGRGRLGPQIITKYRRSQIFRQAMTLLNEMPEIKIFTVCRETNPEWALERLMTRIHRTMQNWNSYASMIFDEGKEDEITRLLRKLGVYNPVPVYVADGVTQVRNVAIDRVIEDPVFKQSDRSYFIQMADFVAYALLRREKRLASKDKYGIHECFDMLSDVVVRVASPRDPMGIIR